MTIPTIPIPTTPSSTTKRAHLAAASRTLMLVAGPGWPIQIYRSALARWLRAYADLHKTKRSAS